MHEEERIKALQAENETLRLALAEALAGLEEAKARIKQLEDQAAKDSHNSSKPPSTNGLREPVRKTQSLREASGKKSGGQPGHRGKTLMMVPTPDHLIRLTPPVCQHCQQELAHVSLCRAERVQVFDVPSLELAVTEYQVEVKQCPCCHAETRAALPAGISVAAVQYGPNVKTLAVYLSCLHLLPVGRVCQILSDLFGTTFSQGSVLSACQQSAAVLFPVLQRIKTSLQECQVIHNDETGFRVEHQLWWLHVAATSLWTLYLVHRKRGGEATDAMGILPTFAGTSIHDGLNTYQHYACTHALCVVHFLRDLTFIWERFEQQWAKDMKALLKEIKARVDAARLLQATALTESEQAAFRSRYQALVQTGLAANPPPSERTGKRSEPLNLLVRMQQYHDQILRFMQDFAVPFDNNQAEADLRMMKLRQKISGCFRTEAGAVLFCDLRSYLSTMRKQGVHLLTALRSTMLGSPLLPPLLAAE